MENSETSDGYRWAILIIVYLSILSFALIFQSIPPILPLITSELDLTYAQSGLLMSLFALPGLFLSLLGGYLSDRYGMKPLGIGCFLLMVLGTLLVGLGSTLWVLWLGRTVAGIGALTLSVLLPKLLSQWFKQREIGLAMGIFNTGVPLGSVICFGLFGKMGDLWGWRLPILFTGGYSLLTSILFVIYYRLPVLQNGDPTRTPSLTKAFREMNPSIWWVGVSWLWFNAAFVSFATFAPEFFLRKGYTIEQSGFLIGIPLLGSFLFSAPTGYLVDRFGHQPWLIGMGGVVLSALAFSFNVSSSFLLLVILMGISSALIPSPVYSLPPVLLKPQNLGLGFGVLSTCSSIGLFVAPYLVGKTRDLTGTDQWSFILIGIFALLITISIAWVPLSKHPTKRL